MTEKPQKMSEILQASIKKLEENLKSLEEKQNLWLKTTSTPKTEEKHEHTAMPDSARGHKTIEEVADCPQCKQKLIDKYRPELFKEFNTKIKSKELVTCLDCGELVNVKEPNCPTCKGTRAKY